MNEHDQTVVDTIESCLMLLQICTDLDDAKDRLARLKIEFIESQSIPEMLQ